MRYDPTTHLMQSIDRHNKKIEELTRRIKDLEAKMLNNDEDARSKKVSTLGEFEHLRTEDTIKRGPGRPRKDAQ